METSFDIRGNLRPYRRVSLSFEDFKKLFVEIFDQDSTRHKIFRNYEEYTYQLTKKVSSKITQWIDGSFISNKKNPRDIDLVNLIDYRIVEKKETLIREEFLMASGYKK